MGEYNFFRTQDHPDVLPELTLRVTFLKEMGSWRRVCRAIRARIELLDTRANAINQWQRFLEKMKVGTIEPRFPDPDWLYDGVGTQPDPDDTQPDDDDGFVPYPEQAVGVGRQQPLGEIEIPEV